MIAIEVPVPGRGTARALGSFLVPFTRDEDREQIVAGALDLFGSPRAVEDIASALASGKQALARWDGQEARVSMYGSGARVRRARVGDFEHALLGVPVFWDLVSDGGVLPGEDVGEVLRYLRSKTAVPVLPEWLPELPRVLRESMRQYEVVGEPPFPMRVVRLVEDPEREIRAALRAGTLAAPGGGPSARLEGVSSLEEYLREFAPELARKVQELARPLRGPGEPDDPRLAQLVRRPLRAQAEVAQGLSALLRRRKTGFLVGDMGTGKTYVACAASWLLSGSGKYRVLVMCPAHLVHKWEREIEQTVPGAKVRVISSWVDALRLPRGKPEASEFFVVSKETAKLGFRWRLGAVRRRGRWECPRCGQVVSLASDGFSERNGDNSRCKRCGEALWQADRTSLRRVAVCDVVKRLPRGYFDIFIGDEAHQFKSAESAQGRAFGLFASQASRTLALTGTLTGGYASDLFHLLYRTDPEGMKRAGFSYTDVGKFVAAYGCLEKAAPAQDVRPGKVARAARARVRVKEKPGISPAVFSAHLLESCAFLELSDLACDLPPYREEVELVDMEPEQRAAYEALRTGMRGDLRRRLLARSAQVGSYVHAALSYPDRPSGNPPVLAGGRIVTAARDLPEDRVWPKEQALLDLCLSEAARGRRVFVYLVYTGTRDVSARLESVLGEAGLRVAALRRSSAKTVDREEWIARQVEEGVQVLIGNARLVELGLDLLEFPTLAFYQTGHSTFTVRQASRRSWRIGQTQPVRVVFLAYRSHLQEAVLRLMGSKLRAALALEGRFSSEGLRAMAQGDDLGVELARVLAEGLEGLEGLGSFGEMLPAVREIPVVASDANQLRWEFARTA